MFFLSTFSSGRCLIAPSDSQIQYNGRIDRSSPEKYRFDWPGITIKAKFEGTSCTVILSGVNCFDAFIDGILKTTFKTGSERKEYTVAERLTDRTHTLLLVKRSESVAAPAGFYGISLDEGKKLIALDRRPNRRIEFIGDSYTVGFANEYLRQECRAGKEDSIILAATNTNKAFGPLTARAFGAQYQILAISGKGLVRNYNGIDAGRELLTYYDYTLQEAAHPPNKKKKWNFSSWKANVVVIGLGINDFQADPPYADSTDFSKRYHALINRLRKQYPEAAIICCATKVWPNDDLKPRVKGIVEKQRRDGYKDIHYFEYVSENGALFGHPHIHAHRSIAEKLIPVVVKATGWRRTDMVRGK